MNTVLTVLGTIAFYAFISVVVYMILRVFEYRSETEMDKCRRAQMKVVALEAITECEQAKMHKEIQRAAKSVEAFDTWITDAPTPAPSKPKDFITVKIMMPKSWCMCFYSDGTEKVFESEVMVEKDVVLHVRKPEQSK